MSTQSEILRAASLLVDAYGEMAVASAFIRADELSARGDEPGHARWCRVARAVEDLLSRGRPASAAVH